jgi:DNA-binding GntR family transcriptional regulator
VAQVGRALTYREIADDLQERIMAGEFPPGSAIPQYEQLGEQYGVSKSTGQRAVMLLRDRDLVVGVPGRGVFVKVPKLGR